MIFASIFFVGITVACVNAATAVTCPAVDTQGATYFPHESDCSKFYQCSNGTPHLLQCPAGLNFNADLNVCDWPENAGCDSESDEDSDDDSSDSSSEESGEDSVESDLPLIQKSHQQVFEGQQCTVDEKNWSVRPHPTECGKYLACYLGKTLIKSCPQNYVFHPKVLICAPPTFVRCNV